MKKTLATMAATVALALTGCGGGPDLVGSQWEADMSTLQWGEAGNSLVQPGDRMYVTLYADGHYDERLTLHGTPANWTAQWEVTSSEGERTTVHVTPSVESHAYDIQIDGTTMTYSRRADVGTVTATLTRMP